MPSIGIDSLTKTSKAMTKENIEKVWLTDTAIWLRTNDGREAREEFANYPRLKWASKEQRENYEADYYGLHWPELDEDLSYEGFFHEKPTNKLYAVFMAHPELNASAIARRLGMAQSLLAQYISGAKKPSKERVDAILSELRTVGAELQAIPF